MEMIKVYSPNDELELSMIRGLFDTEGILYFVHNDHFGSMRVGPQIDLFNKKTIMVAPEDEKRALEIISDLLGRALPEEEEPAQYTVGQKIRMIFETLFFAGSYLGGNDINILGSAFQVDKIERRCLSG